MGGHLANLAPLIGTVTGVNTAPISFVAKNGTRRVKASNELEMDVQELKGMDGANPGMGLGELCLHHSKSH